MSNFMQGNSDSSVAVPFSDDETVTKDEDLAADDAPASATETPEERASRKQKRQERLQLKLQEGKQSKEQLARVEAEKRELETRLARLEGVVSAQRQPAPPADGKDQYDRALDAVYEKQSNAYAAAQAEVKAGTFDEKRAKYYEQIAREVETEKTDIHTQRALARHAPKMRAEQAQQVWVQKYPEVYRDPRAYQYADATFKRRQALGDTVTNDMVDEIMTDTMTQFKLGKKAAPTATERSRMSGMPASGGGGGGGGDSRHVEMTPSLRKMATAAYSDLPEAEAVKKWVNGPGKHLREKKVL